MSSQETGDVGVTGGAPGSPAPGAAVGAAGRRPGPAGRLLRTSPAYMFGVLLVLILFFSILRPDAFPTTSNGRNVLNDAATFMVMAVAMTYVMVAAGLDLSIGSVLVFSGVVSAKVMQGMPDSGLTVFVGLIVAMAGGLVWGIFNGLAVTKLRVPALITTLGTLGAALGVARVLSNGNDIRDVPLSLIKISVGGFLGLSWIVWIAIVVVIIGGLILQTTRFGRHTYIIGSNDEAARRAGIDVDRHLLRLYALSGLFAGLAGMLSLTRFSTTTIAGHAQDPLTVITGVILGGTSLFGGVGTIIGTVVGMFIPAVLQNGFVVVDIEPFWQQVAIGFILIAAVYIDQLRRRSRERL